MQKLTFVVLLTLVVLFGVANANDHTKHHKHEHEHEHVAKTPKFSLIQNIKYPTLSSITTGLKPVLLVQQTVCNTSPLSVTRTVSYTAKTGEDRCWTVPSSLGSNVAVVAGAPVVAETSSGYKWVVGQTRNYKRCVRALRTQTETLTLKIPSRYSCTFSVTQFASPVTAISWTGSAKTEFTDGSSSTTSTSGSYSGTYLTKTVIKQNCTPVTTCASSDDADNNDVDADVNADVNADVHDDDDDDEDSTTVTTTGDDEEDDSVSFELPNNEPKTELLQSTPVGEVATA